MTGEWLIRQQPPRAGHRDGGYHVERIVVETNDGDENPRVMLGGSYLSFTYADGREQIFPYANILRAEYRPHNEP